MRRRLASLLAFFPLLAYPYDTTLRFTWDQPLFRVDQTPMYVEEISHYNLYNPDFPEVPLSYFMGYETEGTLGVSLLVCQSYYMTTVDTDSRESSPSEIVTICPEVVETPEEPIVPEEPIEPIDPPLDPDDPFVPLEPEDPIEEPTEPSKGTNGDYKSDGKRKGKC